MSSGGKRQLIGAVRRAFAPWNDPGATPLIRYEGVTKAFGDFTAVNDVSLDIFEREFFTLLGPSGCGKTTLMRMLAGFDPPTKGRVTLGGKDIAGQPPHRLPVNMMFQSYALFPHMNVRKNVGFGLEMEGVKGAELARRVDEMLALVKLEKFSHRKPDQLSGGQRQRVALARALAKKPKVLLLDEPLGALDKKLREETQYELMDLQVKLGMTFVIVTHDQDEAMTMSDRIAIMDTGRIVQVAAPGELYEQPSCRYVAGFLGDVNLLECAVVQAAGGQVELAARNPSVRLWVQDDRSFARDQTVWLAVRPEKVSIAHAEPGAPGSPGALGASGANQITGKIWDVGYLGDWTTYLVEVAPDTLMRVACANLSRFVERPISWEDPVILSFTPAAGVVLTQ